MEAFTTTVRTDTGLFFSWVHPTRQEAAFALSALLLELTQKSPFASYRVDVGLTAWVADQRTPGPPERATPAPDARSSPFDNEYRPQNRISKTGQDAEHY